MNDQMRVLINKPAAANPLYLLVACEELRLFGVYERLTERIAAMAQVCFCLFVCCFAVHIIF
jgi:telomerase protein component 1